MIYNKCVYPTLCLPFLIMLTRGDEQRAIEDGFYASPYLFVVSKVLSLSLALGYFSRLDGDYDPCQISSMVCVKHLSVQSVLKKVVFTTLALVSPRLYRVNFQHDYTSGFPSRIWGLCQSQGTVYESTSLVDFLPRPMGWVSLEAGGSIGSTTSLGGHETLYWMDGRNLFKGSACNWLLN